MPKPKIKYVPLRFDGDATVKRKRIKQASGKTISIHAIAAESPTFDWELSTVFARNVARARRENANLPYDPKALMKAVKGFPTERLIEIHRALDSKPAKTSKKKSGKSKKR